MKLILICAGGLSTDWLVRRLQAYCRLKSIDMEIEAHGMADYLPAAFHADAVLLGPQVSYRHKEIEQRVGKKIDAISCNDYALANCEKIIEQAQALMTGE